MESKVLVLRNIVNSNSITFDKNYSMFEKGFGNISHGNYWIGLQRLHQLTSTPVGVRFELMASVVLAILHYSNNVQIFYVENLGCKQPDILGRMEPYNSR